MLVFVILRPRFQLLLRQNLPWIMRSVSAEGRRHYQETLPPTAGFSLLCRWLTSDSPPVRDPGSTAQLLKYPGRSRSLEQPVNTPTHPTREQRLGRAAGTRAPSLRRAPIKPAADTERGRRGRCRDENRSSCHGEPDGGFSIPTGGLWWSQALQYGVCRAHGALSLHLGRGSSVPERGLRSWRSRLLKKHRWGGVGWGGGSSPSLFFMLFLCCFFSRSFSGGSPWHAGRVERCPCSLCSWASPGPRCGAVRCGAEEGPCPLWMCSTSARCQRCHIVHLGLEAPGCQKSTAQTVTHRENRDNLNLFCALKFAAPELELNQQNQEPASSNAGGRGNTE